MSLLKNPNQIVKGATFAGIIYGQPGVGKSTLALSAPNPVMIDADKGLHRVKPRWRVPSLPLDDYADLLKLLDGEEVKPFDSIVMDTAGRLIDRMAEYLSKKDPKNRQSDGSLSLKGYGALKSEFGRFVSLVKAKNKNLIYVAHDKEEKDNDTRYVRPDLGSGSAGKDLIKDLDFIGYMEMRGEKRMISFSPCERFYAKNSLDLPTVIEVPDSDLSGNDFIQKFIIDKSRERLADEVAQNEAYDALVNRLTASVDAAKDAETANNALKVINDATPIWDSHRIAKRKLNEKTKEIGLTFANGIFVAAKKEVETAVTATDQPQQQVA